MSFRPYFLILFFITGCSIKRNNIRNYAITNANHQLFIELPRNNLVFENISPLLYDVFTEHFERIGYNIVTKSTNGYTLRITINSLDPAYKYISPDIVLLHTTTRLELLVQLLNYKKDIVAQKNFAFSTLISGPQNPFLSSDFMEFEYTNLLKKAAPKVEQYFRSFLLKSVD